MSAVAVVALAIVAVIVVAALVVLVIVVREAWPSRDDWAEEEDELPARTPAAAWPTKTSGLDHPECNEGSPIQADDWVAAKSCLAHADIRRTG